MNIINHSGQRERRIGLEDKKERSTAAGLEAFPWNQL
jgi:hypothetical protein